MIDYKNYDVCRIAQLKIKSKSNKWIATYLSVDRNRVNDIVKLLNSSGISYSDVVLADDNDLSDLFSTENTVSKEIYHARSAHHR